MRKYRREAPFVTKRFFATEKSKKMFVCLILTFQLSLSFQSGKIEVSV